MSSSPPFPKYKLINAKTVTIAFASILIGVTFFLRNNSSQDAKSDTTKQDAQKINNECKNIPTVKSCLNEKFYSLAKKSDLDYSIKVLESLQMINPESSTGCHLIAHRITQAEAEKDPSKWKQILKRVSPSMCTGGFLHGTLEVHAKTNPEFIINNSTIKAICGDLLNDTWTGERSCYHNMGHLMLIQEEGQMDSSLDNCAKLNTKLSSYECLSGVFMENLTAENLIAHGILTQREPWNADLASKTENLCNSYEGETAKACWRELSYVYSTVYKQDPKGLYDACQKAPEKTMQDECYVYGVGNIVNMPRVIKTDTINLCRPVSDDRKTFDYCMRQVVWTLVTSNTNNIDRAVKLCSTAPEDYKAECNYNMINFLEMNKAENNIINSACGKISKELRPDLCSI